MIVHRKNEVSQSETYLISELIASWDPLAHLSVQLKGSQYLSVIPAT